MKQKRILIANRGEIAIRIAKAVNELGHISVGIWTDNEVHAAHLQYCQEWAHLRGSTNQETYLSQERILDLMDIYEIDAVHPGYGFLSENAQFCERVIEKGVIFIGPNANAMKLLGDKAMSKEVAQKANVPIVPGSIGVVKELSQAKKIAKEIGYPILLKAVAGGGGRGMRICKNDSEVEMNFEAVKRESQSSFGREDLLVEKYIVNPHHIEVQILADKKGNIFHFFERECSVQRRHQKVIEEAPSPFIGEDEALRNEICEAAVRLAKIVNYDSAGTVEFIMGEDKKYFFLEMNTRIQVEHPITEEITGIDLLVCMIQSAFDMDLGILNQQWIKRSGHAIECRICAEDPITMLPSPGLVTGFEAIFPQGIRLDHCLYPGLRITPDFDPMVAKAIAKGINRDVAIRKMKACLEGLCIEGLKTNIPLLKVILEDEEFACGHYTTLFLEKRRPQEKIDCDLRPEAIFERLASIEAITIGL